GQGNGTVALACIADRDGDGRPDVALAFERVPGRPASDMAFEHVVVLSGRDGRRVERAEGPEFPTPGPEDWARGDRTLPRCGPSGPPCFITSGRGSSMTRCFVQPPASGPHGSQPASREPDDSHRPR